jgi:nitrite reductase (NADH) large subunit
LERIYKWARRVGHDAVRAVIMNDAAERHALYARFVLSQEFSQSDPWQERVSGLDKHEFNPLKVFSQEAAE